MVNSVWSLDDGYGDLKGYNGEHRLLLPSYYTLWKPMPKTELGENGEIVDPFSHVTVEYGDEKYLVGNGAIEQDTRPYWTGGGNKHLDDGFPILLKTSLAILSNKEKDVVLDPLVMGLPVNAEEDEERHELLRQLVCGDHYAKVTLANGQVYESNVKVKNLVIKKQPFGSLCNEILDDRGEIVDHELASKFVLIIDIGARTLNIYTLNALEPVKELSGHTNHGMYVAFGWVADFIRDTFNNDIPIGKIIPVIKKGEIQGYDLTKVINRSYETLANQIRRVVDTMFVDSWLFVEQILITGGGAELLRKPLERAFMGKPVRFLDRFATVRGLRKYGIRHAKQTGKVVIKTAGGGIKHVLVSKDEK